jgi:hypothetical protein
MKQLSAACLAMAGPVSGWNSPADFNREFHKEKEMANLRKLFFKFALVALLLGAGTANAQQNNNPQAFTCVANAPTPVIDRVEGITELVGDFLLQCQGGNPTPLGNLVPTINIRLSLNTNITSRLLAGSGFIDALLLIDDPYPNGSNGTGAVTQGTHPGPADAVVAAGIISNITVPANSPFQALCAPRTQPTNGVAGAGGTPNVPASCNYLLGTFNTSSPNTAYGGANSPYLQANQTVQNKFAGEYTASTVYEARAFSVSAVEWDGVPIDPPGTTGVRLVRLTNVRANACQLGLSSTLIPTQIVGFIGITGGQFFTVNNPQQTLAYINQGLVVSGQNTQLQQCNNLNVGGGGIGGNFFADSGVGIAVTNVNIREGFAPSFKRQAYTPDTSIRGVGVAAGSPFSPTGISFYSTASQNVPGLAYNTESGFQPTLPDGATQLDSRLGGAAFGTRILLRFSNIATGVRMTFPGVVLLTTDNGVKPAVPTPPSAVAGWTGGYLVLLGTPDLNGSVGSLANQFNPAGSFSNSSFFFSSGPFKGPGAVSPFNTSFETTVTAGAAGVVYEVVNSDPAAVETGNIPIGVAFISNTAQNIPAPGQAFVNTSFAPTSTDQTASAADFIPRFCNQSAPLSAFAISLLCTPPAPTCNLLFPYFNNEPGSDTKIAIANTSVSLLSPTTQAGKVHVYVYGTGAAPLTKTTLGTGANGGTVPAGCLLEFTLRNGGAVTKCPDLINSTTTMAATTEIIKGFIIVAAEFSPCYGFASITTTGPIHTAESYLAIPLAFAGTGLNRTGITGEVQGH